MYIVHVYTVWYILMVCVHMWYIWYHHSWNDVTDRWLDHYVMMPWRCITLSWYVKVSYILYHTVQYVYVWTMIRVPLYHYVIHITYDDTSTPIWWYPDIHDSMIPPLDRRIDGWTIMSSYGWYVTVCTVLHHMNTCRRCTEYMYTLYDACWWICTFHGLIVWHEYSEIRPFSDYSMDRWLDHYTIIYTVYTYIHHMYTYARVYVYIMLHTDGM